MPELTSSPKAHTITWPFSPKTAEDIDYNFDVLLQLFGRLIAAINGLGGGGITSIPTQTSALLQANVHIDTRTKTRVLGDLIQAIGPFANGEQFFEGQSLAPILTGDDTTGGVFWFEGQVFEGIFGGRSSADVLWDRMVAIGGMMSLKGQKMHRQTEEFVGPFLDECFARLQKFSMVSPLIAFAMQ